MDILIMENLKSFRLLIWTSVCGQLGQRVWGKGGGWGISLFKYHFITVHKNLVQHPSNNISIILS